MEKELAALEDAIRSIWKVMATDIIELDVPVSGRARRQGLTLLLLTDGEVEQLCQDYAEKLLQLKWLAEVAQCSSTNWTFERILANQRLGHFAKVWSQDRVQSILDQVFEGYDPEKERAEFEAQMKREERDRQIKEGPPLEEPPREDPPWEKSPWEEAEPMFDRLPF